MALNFPDAPVLDQEYVTGRASFVWKTNPDRWRRKLPPPALIALVPNTGYMITSGIAVALQGTGFTSTSQVYWDGAVLAHTFVSAQQLDVIAPEGTAAGTVQVHVDDGGFISNALPFTYTVGPATSPPIFDHVEPASGWNTWTAALLTIYGNGFHPNEAVATWDGVDQPTTYISVGQISFVVNCATEALGMHTVGAKNGTFVASGTAQFSISY